MVNFCEICRKYFITKNFLFPIPKVYPNLALSKERQMLWLKVIGRSNTDQTEPLYICSKHFVYGKPAECMDRYNIDWVPTINLCREFPKFPKRESEERTSFLELIKTNSYKQYCDGFSEFITERRERRFQQLILEEMERDKILDEIEKNQRKTKIIQRKAKRKRQAHIRTQLYSQTIQGLDFERRAEGQHCCNEDLNQENIVEMLQRKCLNIDITILEFFNQQLEQELMNLRQELDALNHVFYFQLLNCSQIL